MQPSLEKAALKGLNNGLETAMARIELDVDQVISRLKEQHENITESLGKLINACDELGDSDSNKTTIKNEKLTRMLVDKVS